MIVAIEVFAMCAIAVITLWLFMISVAPSPAFDLLDLIKFSVRPTKKHQQSPEPRHICPGFPLGLTDDELRLVEEIDAKQVEIANQRAILRATSNAERQDIIRYMSLAGLPINTLEVNRAVNHLTGINAFMTWGSMIDSEKVMAIKDYVNGRPGLITREIEAGCHDHLHPKWADLTTAQRIEIIHDSARHMGLI